MTYRIVIAEPFPFQSHLTLGEVAKIERWREKWNDMQIRYRCDAYLKKHADAGDALASTILASGISAETLLAYLRRNPRPEASVA